MGPVRVLEALGRWVLASLLAAWLWTWRGLARIFAAIGRLLGISSKPSFPRETMSTHPDMMPLAERFRLVERGRERGKKNEPAPSQPGLDLVETEVVNHCNRLVSEKKDAYRRSVRLTEQRSAPAVSATDVDAAVEEACDRMRAKVNEERPGLEGFRWAAQKAVYDIRDFKKEHRLTRAAHVPQSLTASWATLAVLLVGETLINGLFFGANLATGLFGGVTYAVLISLVNVGVFGVLAATAVQQICHRDQARKAGGYLLLLVVGMTAVAWNLAVAHYREALPADYPPAVETEGATQVEPGVAECWRGPSEADADGEAICLLLNNWFSLEGFQSYMLMLIGLLMFGVAAWKWLRMNDLYPGFGALERHRQETEKILLDERQDLLEWLADKLEVAVKEQHAAFVDPAGTWKRAVKAQEDLKHAHEELREFARELEEQCRGAIETYRSANREAPRSERDPDYWSKPWSANWELPDKPSLERRGIWDRRRARVESKAAQEQRDERLATLRQCAEECKAQVEQITRISYE